MATHTSEFVPPFDFSGALSLPLAERFEVCIERARELAADYQSISEFPCVPAGATDPQIERFETEVIRAQLPDEYRQFLRRCRYLKLDDGLEIGGLDHDGLAVTEVPWVSTEHRPGVEYLVFANYWRYADGDQLMFDLTEPGRPVVAYLHEHGPLFEHYAPSFSLALWRLVHEDDEE